ncbi:MAG: insulinase family protein, partial [Bacteroidetes bacterium]|nr:insulinase family protein [Bacteroidota bacterium]
ALVEYLESIGMRFGPDINAYTSFDETVYMLQLPTDSAGVIETGFQILRDWAGDVSFDPEEIDKERGVVIEEWRRRRGGPARIQDKQFPVLLHGSKYADRLPIGTEENLATFDPALLTRFYEDWYRPDLMSIIAVGDFDQDDIEALIRANFSDLTLPADKREREFFVVPDHDETLYSIESDPEMPSASVSIRYKHDVPDEGTVEMYRDGQIRLLYASMLNQRFSELTQSADPPFIGAGTGDGALVRTRANYVLSAGVLNGQYLRALKTMLEEAERLRLHGFTASELARARTNRLRRMEVAYNERDKTNSGTLAAEFIRHVLTGEVVPGIELEYQIVQDVIPTITLEEVNGLVSKLMTNRNQVITISGPENDSEPLPSVEGVQAVFDSIGTSELTAFIDDVDDAPLLPDPPVPGSIVEERTDEATSVTFLTLSNGVKVILRPTDFQNDEVLFSATSPGGLSLSPDETYMSASFATPLIGGGGVGSFDPIQLRKKLTGKTVNVRPFITDLAEGFSGSASPRDLETLFRLVYLYGTDARADSVVYASFITRITSMLGMMQLSPQSAFNDTLAVTVAQYHFRSRPFSEEVIAEVRLAESFEFYKDRFADFSDFTFYFVGSFEMDAIRPLIEQYLASLPSSGREENWRDNGQRTPDSVVEKSVYKGLEPQSTVTFVFSGDIEWSIDEQRKLQMLQRIVDTRLREILREDLGGTYVVRVSASLRDEPYESYRFNISFGCDPERMEELVSQLTAEIERLQKAPPEAKYMDNAREAAIRVHEVGLRENGYWMSSLQFYLEHDMDPSLILVGPATYLDDITGDDMVVAARKYLDLRRYVRVSLFPENME